MFDIKFEVDSFFFIQGFEEVVFFFFLAFIVSIEKSAIRFIIVSLRQCVFLDSFLIFHFVFGFQQKRKLCFKFYYDVPRYGFLGIFPGINGPS